MKYICLGYYDKGKFDGMTEGERNAMFDTCFEYDDHLRANGHWAGGEALQPEENALTLYWKNGKVATTDGPYAETKEQLGGILVLEARDMNQAVQLMAQHPALTYGNIFEIRPAGDMNEIMKASEQRRRKDDCTLKTVLLCHRRNRPSAGTRRGNSVIGWFLGAMVRHPSVLPSSRAHQNMGTRYGSDCDQGQRRPGWACLTPM